MAHLHCTIRNHTTINRSLHCVNDFFFCLFKVFAEFFRVASKNLKKDFYEALDHHNARLIELFRCRKGSVGQSLDRLLQPINTQVSVVYDHHYHYHHQCACKRRVGLQLLQQYK